MNNKLLLLFCFCFFASVNLMLAQSLPIDFDDPLDNNFTGNGGSVFTADVSPTDGADNVAKIDGGADQWNSRIDLALDTYIDMTTANKTFTFDFYTTTADVMTGLFQIGNEENGGFPLEMQFTTDGAIGWQTVTLDFTNADNGYPNCAGCPSPQPVVFGQYAQISVFTNFGDTGTSTYYVDDIAGAANGASVTPDSEPMMDAPDPTHDEVADNVISIFSGAYTDVGGTDFNPNWGQSTVTTTEMVESNPTLKYAGLNYQGTQIGSSQDVSGNEFLHVDFWTADATTLDFYLISGVHPASVEFAYSLTGDIVAEQWVSVEIPMSHFSMNSGVDLADITQFKVVGDGTVWFDNWYFHGTSVPAGPVEPMVAAPAPTNACVTSVFSDEYTDLVGTDFNPNWGQGTAVTTEMIASNPTLKYAGLNYQGTQLPAAQDVSGYDYLHVDFWTSNSTALNFYLISGVHPSSTEALYSLTGDIMTEQWVSVDIPLNTYSGAGVDLTDITQFKVDGNGNIWFDNWYFHSDGDVNIPAMGSAATVNCVESCTSGTWSYYADASTPDNYALAIDWGTTNTAAKTGALVTIDVSTAPFDMDDGTNRTWSMGRYWNVTPGAALVDPVSVKFFYDAAEKTAIETAMASDGRTPTGFKWFKTTTVAFDPATHISGAGVSGNSIELTDSNTGGLTESGIPYAQFDGITSFSGGTGAAGVGMSAILPVNLTYFNAKAEDNHVYLNWETASEFNNDYFEIQRSIDGREFMTIDMVQGAGNSSELQTYQAVDKSPINGANYYRLKQVDFDGRFAYSAVQNVEFSGNGSNNTVYPNPTTDKVNIVLATEAKGAQIQVYSLTGQLLLDYQVSEGAIQQSVDLTKLGKGVYRLNILNNGSVESHSIILL